MANLNSIDAERYLLGILLIENSYFNKIEHQLEVDDFAYINNKIIYQKIKEYILNNKCIDVLIMIEEYKKGKSDLEIDKLFLDNLINLVKEAKNISNENINAYAKIIKEHSLSRQIIKICNETIINVQNQTDSPLNNLDCLEKNLFALKQNKYTSFMTIDNLLNGFLYKLTDKDNSFLGLKTGFSKLDYLTKGFKKGQLIIVAARPSMGKTTFSLNMATNIAINQDVPVLIFSLEVDGDSITSKILSATSKIKQNSIIEKKITENEHHHFSRALEILAGKKILVSDRSGINILQIKTVSRQAFAEYKGLGLIVIDYLQLIHPTGKHESKAAEISDTIKHLKGLAKELNLPVVLLSQLNRDLEKRLNKHPMMSDLKASGAIEEDADLILFLHRDEVFNKVAEKKGLAELIIGKNRNGETGTIVLKFRPEISTFEDL